MRKSITNKRFKKIVSEKFNVDGELVEKVCGGLIDDDSIEGINQGDSKAIERVLLEMDIPKRNYFDLDTISTDESQSNSASGAGEQQPSGSNLNSG